MKGDRGREEGEELLARESTLSLSLPREHELPLRKFYSITLVFILVPLPPRAVHFGVVGSQMRG